MGHADSTRGSGALRDCTNTAAQKKNTHKTPTTSPTTSAALPANAPNPGVYSPPALAGRSDDPPETHGPVSGRSSPLGTSANRPRRPRLNRRPQGDAQVAHHAERGDGSALAPSGRSTPSGPSAGRHTRPPRNQPSQEGQVQDGQAPRGRGGRRQLNGRLTHPDAQSDRLHTSANNDARRPPPAQRPASTPPDGQAATSSAMDTASPRTRAAGRRRQINRKLADEAPPAPSDAAPRAPRPRPDPKEPTLDSLTDRLIHALKTYPYPDCPICFSSIHPGQPIWCCSPSADRSDNPRSQLLVTADETDNADAQCCYTPFHLKCIKSWSSKSVKDISDAYRARGEDRPGEWRCPGCQRRRFAVPHSYMCFCNAVPDPRPPRLATPHSCGNPCSRTRPCGHPCALACHPGPCPPCQVTTQLPCHCAREAKVFRCADLARAQADLSCGRACGKMLGCARHRCEAVCHPGACAECPVVQAGTCYCGKTEREMKCGEGEEEACAVEKESALERWTGRFGCDKFCDRPFDCGVHKCEKACHPPSLQAPPCPRSPSLVTHCPCGKHVLSALPGGQRTHCTDPISTCESACMKALDGCNHVCSVPCHTGPCPPCTIPIITPCRCGAATRPLACHTTSASGGGAAEILCDRACGALRACGRHQCSRLCCPLASLSAATKARGKKRATPAEEGFADAGGWHECDIVCGKMLGCGNHRCEARDHRGACAPCLQSSFEEMFCHCGRTVIEPPIPCGTRMTCAYPCALPPPPCGHEKTKHMCHDPDTPCPPCPYLTPKQCACGKNTVNNIRCSQEKVSCGTICGKLSSCGFHHCERPCHGDDCGPCTAVCGKARKLCLPTIHPCRMPCHAPGSCLEADPCQATVTLKCPCGRIQQASACGRSTANTAGREATQQPKCTNECLVARRNARLAEALGISSEVRDRDGAKPVTYADELVALARANAKFCVLVEKSFSDFITSEKKSQVLPYMPEARRKFVHDLAAVYRMDTMMVDQEPRRSVQITRRVDTRVPKPLLSSLITPSNGFGKLADLRAPPARSQPVARPAVSSSLTPGAQRGWTTVVAGPATPARLSPLPSRAGASTPPTVIASATPSWTTRQTAVRAAGAILQPPSSGLGATVARPPSGQSGTTVDVAHPPQQVPDDWENDDDS